MIDWATIEPGLKTLVERLANIPAQMVDEPRDQVSSEFLAAAYLQIFAVTPLNSGDELAYKDGNPQGWAEHTWSEFPWGGASPDVIEVVSAHKELTLRIRVEAYDQTPSATARVYLERIRDRLQRTSTEVALKALGLGFQRTELLTDLPTTYDDRVYSAGAIDIRLSCVGVDEDTDNPMGRIERAYDVFQK